MSGAAISRADASVVRRSARDRVLDLRDNLLASERFRKWASAFPPTRWIARRRARALFDIVAGFAYSQTLRACIELDLFDMLAAGPMSAAEIADRTGLPLNSALTLLRAASALDLAAPRTGDRYGLGAVGASFRGSPGLREMVAHHAMFYADLADPVALLRGDMRKTRLGAYWAYARGTGDRALSSADVGAYTALMSASQRMVAAEILAACPFSNHRRLIDVGGGDGAFAMEVAARYRDLAITVCDLPPVADLAREKLAARGYGDRVTAVACDFRAQPLPDGADIVSLVRVLHDHDDAVAAALLRAIWTALPAGGTILVAEPMSQTPGAEPVGDAYFGFYLLAMGSGRPRTPEEVAAMLVAAGFRHVRRLPTRTPLVASVLVAVKGHSDI